MAARMKEHYQVEIVPAMMERFQYTNVMQVPHLKKVSINIGLGEALQDPKAIEAAVGDLTTITGQKPVVRRARKSIAVYKLREGNPIGVSVVLRGQYMWNFLDRLINIAMPRQRDFQGVSPDAFDGHGNYSLGLQEQLVFPEIDYDTVDKIRGMGITIVTSADSDDEGRELLRLLGVPFKR